MTFRGEGCELSRLHNILFLAGCFIHTHNFLSVIAYFAIVIKAGLETVHVINNSRKCLAGSERVSLLKAGKMGKHKDFRDFDMGRTVMAGLRLGWSIC